MTAPTLHEQVTAKLDALGDTADRIAAALDAAGFRGRRNLACDCPVARYLLAEFSGLKGIYVDPRLIDVWGKEPGGAEITPTPAMAAFLTAFDAGEYPHLVASDQPRTGGGDR